MAINTKNPNKPNVWDVNLETLIHFLRAAEVPEEAMGEVALKLLYGDNVSYKNIKGDDNCIIIIRKEMYEDKDEEE